MSIAIIPKCTIKAITTLIQQFLWGNVGKERYLTLIAWHNVCQHKENGGLGIRDLGLFNKALMLKIVWQVAANEDKLWVQIMRAKYFPRGGFWGVKNSNGSSKLWKSIQELKEIFRDQIRWSISDGRDIPALNQPWYPGWQLQMIESNMQRDTTVATRLNEEGTEWDRKSSWT